jgi:hypothetical protein
LLIVAQCEIVFELHHTPPCMNLLFSVKEYTRLFACPVFFPPLIVFTLNGQISFSCRNYMLNFKKLDFCLKSSNMILPFLYCAGWYDMLAIFFCSGAFILPILSIILQSRVLKINVFKIYYNMAQNFHWSLLVFCFLCQWWTNVFFKTYSLSNMFKPYIIYGWKCLVFIIIISACDLCSPQTVILMVK